MINYTKGEWKAGRSKDTGLWHIHGGASNGEYICCLPSHGKGEANAQLIASAPDLYEALQIGRGVIKAQLFLHPDDKIMQVQLRIVDKALAKAGGKE